MPIGLLPEHTTLHVTDADFIGLFGHAPVVGEVVYFNAYSENGYAWGMTLTVVGMRKTPTGYIVILR